MDRDDDIWAQAGRCLSLGMLLPAGTFAGYFAGYLLDRLFHTSFLGMVFLALGSAAGFIALLRELKVKTKADGS